MFRSLVAVAIAFFCIEVTWGQQAKQMQRIDLNAPGSMEKLRAENPTHYRKIQGILDGLNKHSASIVPSWIRATYKAKDVGYSPYVLTSSPAQRQLSFVLDATQYYGVVTLEPKRAEIYPAKAP